MRMFRCIRVNNRCNVPLADNSYCEICITFLVTCLWYKSKSGATTLLQESIPRVVYVTKSTMVIRYQLTTKHTRLLTYNYEHLNFKIDVTFPLKRHVVTSQRTSCSINCAKLSLSWFLLTSVTTLTWTSKDRLQINPPVYQTSPPIWNRSFANARGTRSKIDSALATLFSSEASPEDIQRAELSRDNGLLTS